MNGMAAAAVVQYESLAAELDAPLAEVAERLRELGERAVALDNTVDALLRAERWVEARERELGEWQQAVRADEIEVEEHERRLEEEAARVEAAVAALLSREAEVEAATAAIAAREEAFAQRWRWLMRSWRRAPRRAKEVKVCDGLFVSTPQGYRFLELRGVAVAPGALFAGLLGDSRAFVVSRIAPLPFCDGWCAYLEEASSRGETSD